MRVYVIFPKPYSTPSPVFADPSAKRHSIPAKKFWVHNVLTIFLRESGSFCIADLPLTLLWSQIFFVAKYHVSGLWASELLDLREPRLDLLERVRTTLNWWPFAVLTWWCRTLSAPQSTPWSSCESLTWSVLGLQCPRSAAWLSSGWLSRSACQTQRPPCALCLD